MLEIGSVAPAFTLMNQDGQPVSLAASHGRLAIIYFYPKDDTPGCTKEACMLRDAMSEFAELNVDVIGINQDSVESHKAFATKYHLPFALLSDPDKTVIAAYGAKGLFTKRISYLVDETGTIAAVYPDVDPATHAATILNDVRALLD